MGYQETSSEDRKLLCGLWLKWYLECEVQWDCYHICVKIGYQETSSEDRRLLCVLWLQWYLECVVQWECYNYNCVVSVRKQTIPTERPQPVGEVSANFSW
jgi:hypothetical protein